MIKNFLANLANKVNKRMDKIISYFGKDNAVVNQYETEIKKMFKGATVTDIHGNLHLSRSANKLKDVTKFTDKVDRILELPTYGELKNKAVKQLSDQGISDPTDEEIQNQFILSDKAEDIIKVNAYKYDTFDDPDLRYAKSAVNIKGRRKTWDEINRIVEILSRDYKNTSIKTPTNQIAEQEERDEFKFIEGVNR